MKIYFDATFGQPWVIVLQSFFSTHRDPKPLFQHIHTISGAGASDDEWIPRLEQGSIVITGDTGIKKPRLPQICKERNITHVILSPTMQRERGFTKARGFVVLWPKILKVSKYPAGTRFQLRTIDAEHEKFTLVRKD